MTWALQHIITFIILVIEYVTFLRQKVYYIFPPAPNHDARVGAPKNTKHRAFK